MFMLEVLVVDGARAKIRVHQSHPDAGNLHLLKAGSDDERRFAARMISHHPAVGEGAFDDFDSREFWQRGGCQAAAAVTRVTKDYTVFTEAGAWTPEQRGAVEQLFAISLDDEKSWGVEPDGRSWADRVNITFDVVFDDARWLAGLTVGIFEAA